MKEAARFKAAKALSYILQAARRRTGKTFAKNSLSSPLNIKKYHCFRNRLILKVNTIQRGQAVSERVWKTIFAVPCAGDEASVERSSKDTKLRSKCSAKVLQTRSAPACPYCINFPKNKTLNFHQKNYGFLLNLLDTFHQSWYIESPALYFS